MMPQEVIDVLTSNIDTLWVISGLYPHPVILSDGRFSQPLVPRLLDLDGRLGTPQDEGGIN